MVCTLCDGPGCCRALLIWTAWAALLLSAGGALRGRLARHVPPPGVRRLATWPEAHGVRLERCGRRLRAIRCRRAGGRLQLRGGKQATRQARWMLTVGRGGRSDGDTATDCWNLAVGRRANRAQRALHASHMRHGSHPTSRLSSMPVRSQRLRSNPKSA